MDETTDPTAGLGTISKLTEQSARFLDGVGVELSVFGLQLIALGAIVAVATPLAVAAWRKEGAARYAALAGTVPLALLALLIFGHWIGLYLNPVPDYLKGRVVADDLHDIRIELLDFRGRAIPAGPPEVDSGDGRFGLNFATAFGSYPRQLKLRKPGCRERLFGVDLARLRLEQGFVVEFRCEEAP